MDDAFALIGLGGLLGANARYVVSVWAADRFGVGFPYGTLFVNVSGSLAMGLLLSLLSVRFGMRPNAQSFLATGFLGAYTTFSTFTYESSALFRSAEIRSALVNVFGSAFTSLAGCGAGIALSKFVAGLLG